MNAIQQFSLHFRNIQKHGIFRTLDRKFHGILSYLRLNLSSLRLRFDAKRLSTDRSILDKAGGNWASLEELLYDVSGAAAPTFLFSSFEQQEYVAHLKKEYPDHVQETLNRANSICQHQFPLLGTRIDFHNNINWNFDPVSGQSWPQDYYILIDRWMWSDRQLGDTKLVWELNRHQHFITLGKAYWISRDEQYADECANQVLSWIRNNPLGFGINWYSSLEIAIRVISWILAFQFFKSSPRFMARAGKPFIKSLYLQTHFLLNNLSLTQKVRNNHIIGEATALVLVGGLFPQFTEAQDWLKSGLRILEDETELQTFSDGANKEQATSYHRFVIDFLILIVVLARRGIIPSSEKIERILEKMLNYVMYVTMPDGKVPMIGDADDGRGFIFDDGAQTWDFRSSLAIGAVLFERQDFKYVAMDFSEEAFWILGSKGRQHFDQLESVRPEKTSVGFRDAGHYIIRDSWTTSSDYAFFKCGPFGWGGEGSCSHSHCDLLSVLLYMNRGPLLVDSGTFTYYGDLRNEFRLTKAHNTVIVDDQEQADPLPFFGWQNIPSAECLAWDDKHCEGIIRPKAGFKRRREIDHRTAGSWIINDTLFGEGFHKVIWFFHFATDLSLHLNNNTKNVVVMFQSYPKVNIEPPEGINLEILEGWGSTSYGKKYHLPMVKASWDGRIPSKGILFSWKFLRIN